VDEKMNKPYVRPLSKTSWFLTQPRYLRYMAREVTCLFIFAYTFLLIMGLRRLAEGQAEFDAFVQALGSAPGVLFNLAVLIAAVYHSTTWFNVTPQAMPIQRGEEFVPGKIIVGAHYALWAVVSLIVLVLGV
jgi:fumarate reductase subunit C